MNLCWKNPTKFFLNVLYESCFRNVPFNFAWSSSVFSQMQRTLYGNVPFVFEPRQSSLPGRAEDLRVDRPYQSRLRRREYGRSAPGGVLGPLPASWPDRAMTHSYQSRLRKREYGRSAPGGVLGPLPDSCPDRAMTHSYQSRLRRREYGRSAPGVLLCYKNASKTWNSSVSKLVLPRPQV